MKALEPALERLADATETLVELQAARENERIRERERRRIGNRSEPKQLTLSVVAPAIPGLAAQFKRTIPPEFWTVAATNVAAVSCPCGATPKVRLDCPVECPGADGPCGRFYLYTGEHVRVMGGPKERS